MLVLALYEPEGQANSAKKMHEQKILLLLAICPLVTSLGA
jgi:hypothetical protein